MLARFSKYDFWIPEKISDWYRKKIHTKIRIFEINFFSRKSRKHIFRDQNIFGEKIGKVNEKCKFQNFENFSKQIAILKTYGFRNRHFEKAAFSKSQFWKIASFKSAILSSYSLLSMYDLGIHQPRPGAPHKLEQPGVAKPSLHTPGKPGWR